MGTASQVYSYSSVKRPKFYYGQLLTAEDFRAEQDYHLAKHRQLTRACLGVGVVQGLHTSCEGTRVTVTAGFAVDAIGRLIELPSECSFDLPSSQGIWEIDIDISEEPCDPMAAPGAGADVDDSVENSRIRDVVKLWIVDRVNVDPGCEPARGVALGRVRVWNGQCAVIEEPRRAAARIAEAL